MGERFIKIPFEIEAQQFREATLPLPFADAHPPAVGLGPDGWEVYTVNGAVPITDGEWIIRGIQGEFYPCKPEIFEKTYRRAAPPADGREGLTLSCGFCGRELLACQMDGHTDCLRCRTGLCEGTRFHVRAALPADGDAYRRGLEEACAAICVHCEREGPSREGTEFEPVNGQVQWVHGNPGFTTRCRAGSIRARAAATERKGEQNRCIGCGNYVDPDPETPEGRGHRVTNRDGSPGYCGPIYHEPAAEAALRGMRSRFPATRAWTDEEIEADRVIKDADAREKGGAS